ncbi:MAG: hypothetical protein GTO14_22990 [Anaerolineales bacterium]|nr:hypothetical protein [Anaerolineales bacterium]
MTESTVIMVVLALGMWFYARRRGDDIARRGVTLGWRTLIRTLPLLVIAFLIVGYIKVLAPQELVRAWIGPESGVRGVLIGAGAGMLLPGGPYVVFPLIAALYRTGAGLGPTLAMITSWSSLALLTVSFELPFLGWRFTMIRFGLGLLIPPLIGLTGALLFGG